MTRRNYPRHARRMNLEDRFDTDVCSLPQRPDVDRIIVIPLKTIFRNMDAAPWGAEVLTVYKFDDRLLELIWGNGQRKTPRNATFESD